jgi:hypothetical protein
MKMNNAALHLCLIFLVAALSNTAKAQLEGYQDFKFGMTNEDARIVFRNNCNGNSVEEQSNGVVVMLTANGCYNIAGEPRKFIAVLQDDRVIQIAVDFVDNIFSPPSRSEFRTVVDALDERYEKYNAIYGLTEWHAFNDGQVITFYSETTNELLGGTFVEWRLMYVTTENNTNLDTLRIFGLLKASPSDF